MFIKWFRKHEPALGVGVASFFLGSLPTNWWIPMIPIYLYWVTRFLLWFTPRLRLGIKTYQKEQ